MTVMFKEKSSKTVFLLHWLHFLKWISKVNSLQLPVVKWGIPLKLITWHLSTGLSPKTYFTLFCIFFIWYKNPDNSWATRKNYQDTGSISTNSRYKMWWQTRFQRAPILEIMRTEYSNRPVLGSSVDRFSDVTGYPSTKGHTIKNFSINNVS